MHLRSRAALRLARGALAQAMLWVATANLASADDQERRLRLVDDRGLPLASVVEACFQMELETDCRAVPEEQEILWPAGFTSLRVEGPAHGPVQIPNLEIQPRTGLATIRVPRKGTLQVRAPGAERLSVSLYSVTDELFRAPLFRSTVGSEPMRVPAGDFVAALSAPGLAPDLHLLSVPPASTKQLRYRARQGWSLVARCVAKTGRTVESAKIELSAEEGYGVAAPAPTASTDRHGLALFSGLRHPLAKVRALHADFLPHEAHGLSSTPGTFGFHPVVLRKGGVARVTILRDNAPAAGIPCQVNQFTTPKRGPAEGKVWYSGTSNQAGVCVSTRLEPGPYILRLLVNRSRVDRDLLIEEDQETSLEVPLRPLAIVGKITRGEKPAPGFSVAVYDDQAVITNRMPRDASATAISDDEGEYRAELWSPGDYSVSLQSPGGSPAAARRVSLDGGEETVDFPLQEREIQGIAVDEHDLPLDQVSVILTWTRSTGQIHRRANTDEQGRFEFALEDEVGQAVLTTLKRGYQAPEPYTVDLTPEAGLVPVVLKLLKNRTLRGFLKTTDGRGVAGAWVAAVATTGAVGAILSLGTTGASGDFELARSPDGASRVFASGPGCPLFHADLVNDEEDAQLVCPPLPASLGVTVQDTEGRPAPMTALILSRDGVALSREVLATHLSAFRLSGETDGQGRMVAPALTPGAYNVYLADATTPAYVAQGLPYGYVGSVNLEPLATAELLVTLQSRR